MGVKLSDKNISGDEYRKNLDNSSKIITKRFINPLYYSDYIFKLTSLHRNLIYYTNKLHKFSMSVIDQRRNYSYYGHKKSHLTPDKGQTSENM